MCLDPLVDWETLRHEALSRREPTPGRHDKEQFVFLQDRWDQECVAVSICHDGPYKSSLTLVVVDINGALRTQREHYCTMLTAPTI